MIRKINETDKEQYMIFTEHFYNSDAVMHPVPKEYREATWQELMRSDEYLECFFVEEDGIAKGFLLLAYTFSQEAGGKVCWIEEIFIEPEYRGRGLGRECFAFIKQNIEPVCKRIRLEVEPDNFRAKKLYSEMGFGYLPYEQMLKGR